MDFLYMLIRKQFENKYLCNVAKGMSFLDPSSCFDRVHPRTGVSQCPGLVSYCTNSVYASLMREQCPKTCKYC
ncbi:shTK domain protein [Dictyocaulus viviparus]|uniref:ShTK domain protein n=1 Tax=Dictyocaulus viviparus TaxID=29172 RepID=A0A0D8XWV1_DICVI|nr:shTK domain protein [Dictyocaulus viviparus]